MRVFILFFTLLFPIISSGQSSQNDIVVLERGEKIQNSPRRSLPQVLGQDRSGGLYALQTKAKRFYGFSHKEPLVYNLQHFDADLNLIKTKKLELTYQGNPLKYQFVIQLDQDLYLFSSFYKHEKERECLLAQKVDPINLSQGKAMVIAEVYNPNKDGFFNHELSREGNRLLIAYSNSSLMKGKNEKNVGLFVLDKKLRKLWHNENALSKAGLGFIVEQYRVDDKGNVFLLSTMFPDRRVEKRKGDPTYQYYLTAFMNNGKEEEEYGINLKGKFITDLQIELTAKNELIGGGFYAEEGSFDVKGSYFFAIDSQSRSVVSKSVLEFDPGFLGQTPVTDTKKNVKENRRIRKYGFTLNDILLREDGSAVLLGEQYFVSSATTFSRVTKRVKSNYLYDFNDIVVVNINKEGEMEWAKKVVKQQSSYNDAGLYSSYVPLQMDGDIYFLYNTYFNRTKGKKKNTPVLNFVKLDSNGNLKKVGSPVISEKDLAFIPKGAIKSGNSELIMLSGGKKNTCFIKFRVQKPTVLSKR